MATFLPSACRRYIEERGLAFREALEPNGQRGLVLGPLSLPAGKFTACEAEVLILLPAGYPDTPPDMFYTDPWLKLLPDNKDPNAASVALQFEGKAWQRWSRHNSAWRPGKDGIWTMLKRIETAIAEAK
jgi:hypothetical protein